MGLKFEAKTRAWKITLCVVIVFILFLVLWLLIGDVDLLDKDYIVPKNGILWSGTVTDANVNWLAERYWSFQKDTTYEQFLAQLQDEMHKKISINALNGIVFNPIIIYWMLGATALGAVLPVIGRLCKFNNWDQAPYVYAMIFACWIFIVPSALIPYFGYKSDWLPSMWWLVRILIMIVAAVAGFFVFNLIFKNVMAHSKYSSQYINELKSTKQSEDIARKDSQMVVDSYIEQRNKEDITYIEKDLDEPKKKH